MQRSALIILLNFLLVVCALAQTRNNPTRSKATRGPETEMTKQDDAASARRRFWISMSITNALDTNINHDPEGVTSFGLIPSLGFHFRDNAESPSFELDYEVALHRYSRSDQFDRVSHSVAASYRKKLSKHLYARTTGEVALKGSSEDREVNNNYVLEQQLQYRFTSATRLSAFAAYRVKRYPAFDSGSDAIDSYVGGRFDQRFGRNRLELAYRYDHNRAQDPRDRYIRRTYTARVSAPLSLERGDSLEVGFRFSPRKYQSRLIRVNGVRELRHDQRWVFGAAYLRPLRKDVTMALDYSYERRNSNDIEKRFSSNSVALTFTFNWWK